MEEESHCQEYTKRVLIILASPNDERSDLGGTLAKLSQQGICVVLLFVTNGEVGTSEEIPQKSDVIRERDMREKSKHLGIGIFCLGYQNGELSKIDQFDLLEDITCWIGLVQPQVIITVGPDGVSRHPDQVTISHMVTQAYDQYYRKGMLLYISPLKTTVSSYGDSAPITGDRSPLVRIEISDNTLEKAMAPQFHTSQYPALNRNSDTEIYKTPCQEIYSLVRNKELDGGSLNWMDSYIVGHNL